MSIAGVQSSRGDAYQTIVAAGWAIRTLYEPIEWLELDATSLDPSGNPVGVDDIVIAYTDKRVYCQCKKNSPTHEKWTPSALQGDLEKAGRQLARDPSGLVRFYSRSPFGDLSRLTEHARIHPDSPAFVHSLPESLRAPYTALLHYWGPSLAQTGETAYSYLRRIEFEVTSDFPDLQARQLGELRQQVSQHARAYEALTSRLDSISRRIPPIGSQSASSTAERLTRDAILSLLASAGAVQTPPRAEQELDTRLRQLSKIGRAWTRTIGGIPVPRVDLRNELLSLLANRPSTVLIHAGPGFGKTCVLLDLVETLESSPQHFALYLQGRVFAAATSDTERAGLGLNTDLVGTVARAAEFRHTIVIVDSLDVLSLNREHASLGYFLSLIDRFASVRDVTIVAACRTFDLKYDTHLSQRDWIKEVAVGPLDWESEVIPILREWGIDPDSTSAQLRGLLRNPRMLSLFSVIGRAGSLARIDTEQELTERYLDIAIERAPDLGEQAVEQLSRLAAQMLAERRLDIPRARAGLPQKIETALLSATVLIESGQGRLAFAHQTLLDVLAVRHAQRAGDSLLQFIGKQPQTPFIRPTIRAFFFYLRDADPSQFRRQVRAALDAPVLAYHLKRLLVESMGELTPTDDDWPLVNHLIRAHPSLFDALFFRLRTPEWFRLLQQRWFPELLANQDADRILACADRISLLADRDPGQTIELWRLAISLPWVDHQRLRMVVGLGSRELRACTAPGAREIVEWLVSTATNDHDFAAGAICRFVEATDSGDELLWRYITSATEPQHPKYYQFGDRLRCGPNHAPIPDFLPKRMTQSDSLLALAVSAVNGWADRRREQREKPWDDRFLHSTSYTHRHTRHERHYVEPSNVLFGAIEMACMDHAARRSQWWVENEVRLRQSADGALRYIALRAYTEHPGSNLPAIVSVLRDEETFPEPRFRYEVNELIRASITLLDPRDQESLEARVFQLGAAFGNTEPEVIRWRRDRFAVIPAFLRSPVAQRYLDEARQKLGDGEGRPEIEAHSGVISSPISDTELHSLSNLTLLALLDYIYPYRRDGRDALRNLTLDQFSWQLTLAVSKDPERFLELLRFDWFHLPAPYRRPILDGVTNHLRFRFGNLSSNTPWEPLARPDGAELASALMNELERHGYTWRGTLEGSQALNACAHVLDTARDAERFAFLLLGTWRLADVSLATEGDVDLLTSALNSPRGVAAEAAAIVARRIGEAGAPLNALLQVSLKYFAQDESAAVRAVLINYLPGVQAYFPEFGWQLFSLAITEASPALWNEGERCLYYAYHRDFDRVKPFLTAAEANVGTGTGAMWGRIATLAMLSGHIPLEALIEKLRLMANVDAWGGAASVFATNASHPEHQGGCFTGLQTALGDAVGRSKAALEMTTLLRAEPAVAIPQDLLTRYFEAMEATESRAGAPMYEFQKWLARRVQSSPDDAMTAAELAILKGPQRALHIWDEELYPKILTSLFREAEDREELDGGAFLRRAISLQDALVKLGDTHINAWLTAAERP